MVEAKLVDALYRRQRDYSDAIDRLRELATDKTENEVYEATATLREAIALVGCLRRLTQGRTANEIHRAYGAPGDFGYETPIGDALAALYRAATDDEQRRAAAKTREGG